MNKIIITVLFTFFCSGAFCQLAAEKNIGRLYRITVNNEVTGSPFLYDEWKPAKLTLVNGTEFDNIMVKLDLLRNTFYFTRNDSTFEYLIM
jgi:hypothetical protein